jgi:hypothetical protein
VLACHRLLAVGKHVNKGIEIEIEFENYCCLELNVIIFQNSFSEEIVKETCQILFTYPF